MTRDTIERHGDAVIQHGKLNDRAYVMKIGTKDIATVIKHVLGLARCNGYSKIFAKVPSHARDQFMEHDFVEEARIPSLFQCQDDIFFVSRFFSDEREQERRPELVDEILRKAKEKAGVMEKIALPPGLAYQPMGKREAREMADLYRQVFASYPFPIHDPGYLAQTMDENLFYFGIRDHGKLVALSSAEIDFTGQNAEMTDFATLPETRGLGLATYLLAKMEESIRQIGIKTAYTIARAYSFGINITFAKNAYTHAGSLINNTQISGTVQSMNVWYKPL